MRVRGAVFLLIVYTMVEKSDVVPKIKDEIQLSMLWIRGLLTRFNTYQ